MDGLSLKFRLLVAYAALSHFVYLLHCSRAPSVCAAGPASSVPDFALPETVLRIPLLPLLPVALLPDRACHLLLFARNSKGHNNLVYSSEQLYKDLSEAWKGDSPCLASHS